jgi:hypothetical protein
MKDQSFVNEVKNKTKKLITNNSLFSDQRNLLTFSAIALFAVLIFAVGLYAGAAHALIVDGIVAKKLAMIAPQYI